MSADHISLEHAKDNKLFYFVANVVVYRRQDGRCLLLKRSTRETAHPGKWAVPGGKLEWKNLDLAKPTRINGDILDFEDAMETLLIRETREEAGIEIEPPFIYLNSVAFVRPDGIPVVLIKCAGTYKSGEVTLEEQGFTEYAWVNAEEVDAYDAILGIQEEVKKTITLLEKII